MEILHRACERLLSRACDAPRIVLRHAPSGLLLSVTTPDGEAPLRFSDRATAESFQRRFLDEQDAWEALPDHAAVQAA